MANEILFSLVIDNTHKTFYLEHERGGERILIAQTALSVTRAGGESAWQALLGASIDALATVLDSEPDAEMP